MHAYVINLARSLDRRAYITAELRKIGLDYEIITAVDGNNLDLHDSTIIDPSLIARSSFPAGTAGCALSHLRAYQKIVTDGLGEALILEDDVRLPADLGTVVGAVARHLTGAEVALLNYGSFPPDICKISLEGSVDLPSSRLLALPIDVSKLVNAGAYVITREACKRMNESVLPIRATADDWGFFYKEGVLDRVRCVLPLPVAKNPKFESTIGLYSLGNGVKARLVGPLVRHKIPLLHQVILYRRQRILRRWDRSEIVDMPFIEKPSRLG
jgi:glycosyl transferase, family 25